MTYTFIPGSSSTASGQGLRSTSDCGMGSWSFGLGRGTLCRWLSEGWGTENRNQYVTPAVTN